MPVEVICLEAVKRLVRYHDLDVTEIEATGVFPLKLLKSSGGAGLLISSTRRYVNQICYSMDVNVFTET